MTLLIKIDLNVARPSHPTSLVHIAAMYCLPFLFSVRIVAAMCFFFIIFSFFIIVSIVPGVFHAHRIIDSETSQTRLPQLLVYCLPTTIVFQFIIRMPFCEGQSPASQQRWPHTSAPNRELFTCLASNHSAYFTSNALLCVHYF